MRNKTLHEALYEVKSLRKLVNKGETYFLPQLKQAEADLSRLKRNDSFFLTPRSSMTKLPNVKFEQVS
jgi:hypothetical protein